MLTLPKLSNLLFEQLHNSTWRLLDEAAQVAKVKKLALQILDLDSGGRRPANDSVDKFKAKWLIFHEHARAGRKTRSFRVYNLTPGKLLGEIKWSGYFRSFSFFPADACSFSLIDLADIQEFIDLLMEERRKQDQALYVKQDRELK